GTQLNCDDGNTCTTDLPCDPTTGCHYIPVPGCCTTNADCADSSACTINERCVNGSCTSDPLDCDDHQACTSDSCDPASVCQHTAALDASHCSAAAVCNDAVSLRGGLPIAGTHLNCDDGNACTTDPPCDPSTGCHSVPIPGCCTTDADCADTSA